MTVAVIEAIEADEVAGVVEEEEEVVVVVSHWNEAMLKTRVELCDDG